MPSTSIIHEPQTFLKELETKLKASDESPFWQELCLPATQTILELLFELKKQKLLFNPEGKILKELNLKELLRWYDLVSLKTLAFILDQSNQEGKLLRTQYPKEQTQNYRPIDLNALSRHLLQFSISLEDELADFPNRFFVQHQELGHIVHRLMG